jgi:hypothetical protein
VNPKNNNVQRSFADVGGDEVFRKPPKPSRGQEIWPLKPATVSQLKDYKLTLIRQGNITPGSAHTYYKSMRTVVKQAQRHLGRQIDSVWEIYEIETIAAIAKDDRPFDSLVDQLADYTLKQRRVVLRSFIRTMAPVAAEAEVEELLRNDDSN